MKQFVLGGWPDKKGLVSLEGGDYRYLVRVRRLAPGEFFPALLPDGSRVRIRVRSVGNSVLVGEVAQDPEAPPGTTGLPPGNRAGPALPPIVLFQAIPKGDKMDVVVRQAAECALAQIVPFESEFSDVRIGGTGGQKFSRWERIIKEARQQSGSMTATAICRPVTADGLFDRWEKIRAERPGTVGLLFHHLPLADAGPGDAGAGSASLHRYLGMDPQAVVLAIGPEGGFSPGEVERFLSAGFRPFTIGDTILRTETAALYAHAAIRILLLERDSWKTM
ncbi:MAG: 16S rRNA (uracil(1498)-N(3))-methyltransferase [Treponema sp.]|nr:16S rRNA (uracil(1498)-N(3))-methyltransferase [Treponema sp.]